MHMSMCKGVQKTNVDMLSSQIDTIRVYIMRISLFFDTSVI
jgi:hypothetical protein